MSLQAKRYKKIQCPINLHAINQRNHTIRRFKERLDIRLSIQDYKNLVNQIHCKQSYFVKMITKRLKNHFVKYKNKFYLVGYDKKTKQICTVLPV